ncbi:type IV secretory system conjugative DNA transfer family protein [Tenacibaculum sp. TC6]|uniref:type IV secretory system conjugative DNA transfer family protein n=1 Tax=Tenacibaculum sp. TC6 TaxID=3423223 RepID=UPI003D36E1B9
MADLLDFLFGDYKNPNTRFLEGRQKRKLLNKKNIGVYICEDGNLPEDAQPHLCLLGGSGAGKTTRYLINSILSLTTIEKSIIVFDAGGDIFDITSEYASSIGFKIKVIDFESQNQLRFNPLHRIKPDDLMGIQMVAQILITSGEKQNDKNEFWNASAISILVLIIEAVVSDNQTTKPKTLETVYELLNMFCTDEQPLLDAFMLKHISEKSRTEYLSFVQSQTEKVLMTVLSVCKTALSRTKPLNRLMGEESLFFEEIRQIPTIIYLKISENLISHYSFAITLFYYQIFQFLMILPKKNEKYIPVQILADEANSFKIPDMENLISVLRRRKVFLSTLWQSYSQISSLFGKDGANTVLGNSSTILVLPGIGSDTADRISHMLGTFENEKGYQQKVMTSREIRMMKKGTALFIHSNYPPAIVSTKGWYEVRKYRNRANIKKKGGVVS